jgi:hypothetical protein
MAYRLHTPQQLSLHQGDEMRFTTAVIVSVFIGELTGCGVPADENARVDASNSGGRPKTMDEARKTHIPEVGKVSSALNASTCTGAQLQAATQGQDILLGAMIDAANAYAANPNSEEAINLFGQRTDEQMVDVYYNFLWAIEVLQGDGHDFNIEYNCVSTYMCPANNLAWSQIPYFTAICDPDDPLYWSYFPYWQAHEMFHWLGWGDPQDYGRCDGDCREDVLVIAKYIPELAIQMPEAYKQFVIPYINARFPGPLYPQ